MKTSFILPVRDRVVGARETIESIRKTTEGGDIEIILVVQKNLETFTVLEGLVDIAIFYEPREGQLSVYSWNLGTKLISIDSDVVVVASSDMVFLSGWYESMLGVVGDAKEPMYLNLVDFFTGDRAGPFHALTRRALVKYFDGYIYPPQYYARFCDNEMFDRAKELGIYHRVPGVSVAHRHYSHGQAPYDSDYASLDLMSEADGQIYARRKAAGWVGS